MEIRHAVHPDHVMRMNTSELRKHFLIEDLFKKNAIKMVYSFDLPQDEIVMHFMGVPDETRHLVVRNEQVVLSPSWSIHAGAGTSNYTAVWGMAGENQTFTDIDWVDMVDLR